MNELIDAAADRLANMENGAEKNALAMKLFGKGGLDMVKVLGKGSKGLAKLSAEAEKYGLVLTKDNVEAVKKSVAANRDQEAAYQGLQLQIGMHVLPLVTKLTTAFASAVPKITAFVNKHQWVAKVIGGVVLVALAAYIASMGSAAVATLAATWPILAVVAAVGALAFGLKWAYQNVGWFHDAVDAVASFITKTVVPAVKEFFAWVGPKLSAGFAVVSAYITNTVIPTLSTLWRWFNDNIVPALQLVARVASWLLTYAFGVAVVAVQGFIVTLSALNDKMNNEVVPALSVTASVVTDRLGFAFAVVSDYLNTTFGPTLAALSAWFDGVFVPAAGRAALALRGQLGLAFGVVATYVTGTLVPALARLVNWLSEKLGGAIGAIAQIIGSQLSVAFTVASTFFNVLAEAGKGLWRVLSDIVEISGDVVETLSKIPSALNGVPGSGLVLSLIHI
jgi:hypothetical protein